MFKIVTLMIRAIRESRWFFIRQYLSVGQLCIRRIGWVSQSDICHWLWGGYRAGLCNRLGYCQWNVL